MPALERNRPVSLPIIEHFLADANVKGGMMETHRSVPSGKKQIEKDRHIRGRNWISHITVALSDGLVTNLSLLTGFAAVDTGLGLLRLAGVAVLLGGLASEFFNGVLESRSEIDLFDADAKRESKEIEREPEEEKRELESFYVDKGLTPREAALVVSRVASNKKKLLEDLLLHELRIHRSNRENPYLFGLVAAIGFVAGAIPPLLPYLLFAARSDSLLVSIAISLALLFAVGAWKGRVTGKGTLRSGAETVSIGAIASAILFLIGHFLTFV